MSEKNPWLRFIDEEARILSLIEHEEVFRGICLHSQQLAEKLLKAELHRRGKTVPWVHDLLTLADKLQTKLPIENA